MSRDLAIDPTDDNTLEVRIQGGLLYFWVNDELVGTAQVDASASGYWGMFVTNFDGTTMASYESLELGSYD